MFLVFKLVKVEYKHKKSNLLMEGGIHLHAFEGQRNPHECLYPMLSKSYKRIEQPALVDQGGMDPGSWAQFATRI